MGRSRFLDHLPDDPEATAKIYVKVFLKPLEILVLAQLDTGAPWLFFDRELLEAVGVRGNSGTTVRILTRFGPKAGRLERIEIVLPADEGDPLTVQGTVFVCD